MMKFLENLKLSTKLLLCIWVPLIVCIALSILSILKIGSNVSNCTIEPALANSIFYMNSMLEYDEPNEEYYIKNGDLYKGEVNISNLSTFSKFKENTGIDVSILYNGKRMNSSITSSIGKTLDNDIYDDIINNSEKFYIDVNVDGKQYYGYYKTISMNNNGDNVILFTGIDSSICKSSYLSLLPIILTILLVPSLFFGLLAILSVKRITKRIKYNIDMLYKLSECDLSVTVSDSLLCRKDEVGDISRSVDIVIHNLIKTVSSIKCSVDKLNSFIISFKEKFDVMYKSTSTINSAVEEIASGAVTQAGETQDVNSKLIDVGESVSKASNNIDDLKSDATSMMAINNQLNTTLNELITISNNTKSYIDTVNIQTNDTNKSANDIQNVVNIISDIAEQTNLLSLNASIEAARAGEQGKGFAVVATEVRTLAEQCKKSAEEISKIVKDLSDKSCASVSTMENVMEEISVQNNKLDDTKKVFELLNDDIQNVSCAVSTISDHIHSIDESKNSVLGNLESLAAISQENAASTEETSSTMEELGNITIECNTSVEELVNICNTITDNLNKFKV